MLDEERIEKEFNLSNVEYVGENDIVFLFKSLDENGNKIKIVVSRVNGKISLVKE